MIERASHLGGPSRRVDSRLEWPHLHDDSAFAVEKIDIREHGRPQNMDGRRTSTPAPFTHEADARDGQLSRASTRGERRVLRG
jgi:hypothetical protein